MRTAGWWVLANEKWQLMMKSQEYVTRGVPSTSIARNKCFDMPSACLPFVTEPRALEELAHGQLIAWLPAYQPAHLPAHWPVHPACLPVHAALDINWVFG